jgi:glycerol-3-phosphate dehydrogenase (NAD(P)+)
MDTLGSDLRSFSDLRRDERPPHRRDRRPGSWGTALVKLLSTATPGTGGLVGAPPETIAHIAKYGHNPDYISAAQFEVERLAMDTDIHAVVKNADVLVIAVPSAFLKATMDQLDPSELKGKTSSAR